MASPADSVSRPYVSRLLLAFFAAFGVVSIATIAVGGRGYDWHTFVVSAIVTSVIALPAAILSSSLVRRNDLGLVLLAQVITVMAIGAFNFLA